MSLLTVVMPAAGKGTRLNLPYPKEILRLDKEQALIDYSFDFFRDYGRRDIEFVIVINEEKIDIVRYLSKYKDKFNISFTFQNPNEREYTGAIKSARHLFGEHNVVLLPDTIMTLKKGTDLVEAVQHSVTETGFTFFYKRETSEKMLRTKGALIVDDSGVVEGYEDKPEEGVEKYNAYWCSFAFRKRTFDAAIAFMEKSTLRQRVLPNEIETTPIHLSQGIQVDDYKDLGTWDEIRRLLRDAI